jgi:hypothetical protein
LQIFRILRAKWWFALIFGMLARVFPKEPQPPIFDARVPPLL